MNSKALAAVASLWLPVVASAADGDATTKLDSLSQKFERILATQGISFGGQFRGEFGASDISGDGVTHSRRTGEQIGYTSVDFDLRARPNTLTQARAVFRMHLDDASFFGAPYTPIETRWLSLDGKTSEGIFYYHLGSFQQRWSPLIMWSPDPSFVYTPRIFAQQQKQAMDERFLGGNVRNLQGADIGIRAAVPAAAIDSFNVSLMAAKLLTAAPLGSPLSSFISSANISGDKSVGYPDSLANFDRWALGGRGIVTFRKAFTLGGSFILEKDLKSTFGTTDPTAPYTLNHYFLVDSVATGTPVSAMDSTSYSTIDAQYQKALYAQNGRVMAFQAGLDGAKLTGSANLILGLDAEVGLSAWDYLKDVSVSGQVDTGTELVPGSSTLEMKYLSYSGALIPEYRTLSGAALNVALEAGWKTSDWSVKAMGGFLSVDSAYRSDLAQSKVFNSATGRIYNSEQDVYTNGSFTNLLHYNTFDALYHNVHHWTAESQSPQNEVAKIPYDKLSYSNYVAGWATPSLGGWTVALGQAVLAQPLAQFRYDSLKSIADSMKNVVAKKSADSIVAGLKRGVNAFSDSSMKIAHKNTVEAAKLALYDVALNSGFDRDLQLVLPGGEASANRVGPKVSFEANVLGGGVELMGNAYMLQEAKGTILDDSSQVVPEKAKFQQIQAGAKFRLDRFVPGWNTLLKPKTPQPLEVSASFGQATAKGGAWLNYTSTEMAASLYVGVLPRLALLGGYQAIQGKDKSPALVDRNQTDIAGGLEFKIQEGAYFLAMYNLLKTEYPNASEFNFDQKIWSTKISVSF